jgi:hypothetical protein
VCELQARLKILLQTRLKESGWHDEMADYCRGVMPLDMPLHMCMFNWR